MIKKIERNYKRVIDRLPYISAIIVFIATLIIYNTIKLSVYARKETIKTLQLIGATRIFVKLPFIFEGIFIGIISVSLVFPALILTIKTLNYMITNFSPFSMKIGFDPFVYIWMFLLIFVISLVGSYRATSSFLKYPSAILLAVLFL